MKELFILPFDHRSSFSEDILGVSGNLSKGQKKEISDLKEIIFEGFLMSLKRQKNKKHFAILVDEEYGKKILSEAKKRNIMVSLPVEKSGREELALEYGKSFGKHIDRIHPDFVKILIRYNPLNKDVNKNQLKTLSIIDKFARENKYKIILELLVPPAKEDLKLKNYDSKERLERTIGAIKEIKEIIKVYIWKMEGFTITQWKKIIPSIGKNPRIIFLGRGQEKAKVIKWLKSAAGLEEIIGFAIGRTIFLEVLKKYYSKKISRGKAIKTISENFDYYIGLWKKQKG